MKMKFTKAYRDLVINPKRTFMAIFALVLGIWGAGTVLVSYSILTKDLNTNFQNTSPAQLILKSGDFDKLNLDQFINKPEIETAEFRDFSLQRIEINPDEWVPLFLYGVEDFNSISLAKIFNEEGSLTPKKGSISIERDGKNMSNIDIGSNPRIRVGGKMMDVPVSGICFDPAQAPATQDHFIYAYTDKSTFSHITGVQTNKRLIIRFNNVQSKEDVEQVSAKIMSDLAQKNIHITSVDVPLFNEHPHQWQLNTILFLVGVIGLLAFIMGAVLVSQLMRSIMANQVRQIGIFKAIGASRIQSFQIYITMLLIMGLCAGVIAVPLAVLAGEAYANFVAGILNFNILTSVPISTYVSLFLVSLFLPIVVSFSILLKGTRIPVREALSDYGINNNSGNIQLKFLRKFNLSNTLILAIKNSLRNSRRLSVTIATMALGVAIFSTGFNVRQSLKNLLSDLETELKYDVQVVLNNQIPQAEAILPFKSIENVKEIATWNGGSGAIQSKVLSTAKEVGIVALPFDTELIKPKIIEGNWLEDTTDLEIVLNQKAWETYDHAAIGTKVNLTIGDTVISTKLVGVVEQFDKAKLYMDAEKYDVIFNPEHLVNTLTFVAKDNDFEKVLDLKRNIETSIASSDLSVLFVMSDAERVKVIYDHLNIILSTIVILSFLVLIVSAIGMASATGINIGERTREIGVMRAIGATPKMIYSIFVSEGMIISFVSILLGIIISYPLSKVASVFFGNLMLGEEAVLQYAFSPLGFAVTLGVTISFGWLASRIPARNAVKTSTREALDYE